MPIPKWLNPKSPQEEGRRLESKIAKKVGGRVQPGSGAFPNMREDIETRKQLIQLKRTTKKQYTLKLDDLETLRTNAIKKGKEPIFIIMMGGRLWMIKPSPYDGAVPLDE